MTATEPPPEEASDQPVNADPTGENTEVEPAPEPEEEPSESLEDDGTPGAPPPPEEK